MLERRQTCLHPDLSNLQQNNPRPLQNCDARTHAVYPVCSALPARHACYQTTLLITETCCVSAEAPMQRTWGTSKELSRYLWGYENIPSLRELAIFWMILTIHRKYRKRDARGKVRWGSLKKIATKVGCQTSLSFFFILVNGKENITLVLLGKKRKWKRSHSPCI